MGGVPLERTVLFSFLCVHDYWTRKNMYGDERLDITEPTRRYRAQARSETQPVAYTRIHRPRRLTPYCAERDDLWQLI